MNHLLGRAKTCVYNMSIPIKPCHPARLLRLRVLASGCWHPVREPRVVGARTGSRPDTRVTELRCRILPWKLDDVMIQQEWRTGGKPSNRSWSAKGRLSAKIGYRKIGGICNFVQKTCPRSAVCSAHLLTFKMTLSFRENRLPNGRFTESAELRGRAGQ